MYSVLRQCQRGISNLLKIFTKSSNISCSNCITKDGILERHNFEENPDHVDSYVMDSAWCCEGFWIFASFSKLGRGHFHSFALWNGLAAALSSGKLLSAFRPRKSSSGIL